MVESTAPFPESVAEIPDGQRRWARRERRTPILLPGDLEFAYEAGAENVRQHIAVARDEGVRRYAVWGGSVDNLLHRPAMELAILHRIYTQFLLNVRDRWMHEKENAELRFLHMGRRELLNETERQLIDEISERTRECPGMVVALCLGYGGWDEIERAMTAHKEAGSQGDWREHLDLPRQGVSGAPFDLIVRTGEGASDVVHDNEYMLAYRGETRLRFHRTLFPDYTPSMLHEDIASFRRTEQRRGA